MQQDYFLNSSSGLYSKNIKIGRVDMSRENWFLDLHPNLAVLPNWVIYVRGEPHYFRQTTFINRLVNNIIKIVEPYQVINSLREFENLMLYAKEDVSGRHLVRYKIVGLFTEPDEYEEVIENFKFTAQRSYWREDSVFALCTKAPVVREIYGKYGSKYIPNPYDKNSIFYLRMKNRFAHGDVLKLFDLSKPKDLGRWLAENSISPLEEMTSVNQMTFSAGAPLLVAFVDPKQESKTQQFLDSLEPLGRKYLNRMNFAWVDYRDNLELMKRLGQEGCRYA
jgi:hypothetical protein